jgi:hypothetical protein
MNVREIQVILVVDNYYECDEYIPKDGEIIIMDEKLSYILIHSDIKLFTIPDEKYEDTIFEVKKKWYTGDGRFFINVLYGV